MNIRVAVVDDQHLIRGGIASLLRHTPDVEVVGEAGDGREGVDLVRREKPDVVLMDIRMPVLDGIGATAQITSDPALSETHVVVLTTFEGDAEVLGALRAGAVGFLGKGAAPEELLHAVRSAASGDALLSPTATAAVVAHLLAEPTVSAPQTEALSALTERELEVVALVAEGLSNDEIAGRLHISPLTAKTHVSRALTKTGARDRVQLVVLAYRARLVVPGMPPG
ncbi:response regulator transcription factor [Microbacterium sp. W1N]|uniref:response regulator n=1 Tax=Microbacterium festucae TaxID=2977531 RepID=UPI0021C17E8D|nr:response regulator transcription factor [Microbacterium festucae]MCT9818942.1 response regulator transcription factor [Microbacterium festucae]